MPVMDCFAHMGAKYQVSVTYTELVTYRVTEQTLVASRLWKATYTNVNS